MSIRLGPILVGKNVSNISVNGKKVQLESLQSGVIADKCGHSQAGTFCYRGITPQYFICSKPDFSFTYSFLLRPKNLNTKAVLLWYLRKVLYLKFF